MRIRTPHPADRTARHATQALRRAAFTLMEMLIVVAIIVMLAGLGGVYLFGQYNDTKKSTAKINAQTIAKACDLYKLKNGQYPPNLEALNQVDQTGNGPYLSDPKIIYDPWGNQFHYDASGGHHNGMQADVWAQPPDGSAPCGNW
jgi:general secretion pathway protein G